MTNKITVLCLLFTLGLITAHASLEFESTTLSATSEASRNDVLFEFAFQNKGTSTAVIHNIKTSCGCTVATLESKEYAPEAKGVIKVKFDIGSRTGLQRKEIQVEALQDGETRTYALQVEVNIPAYIDVQPKVLRWTKQESGTKRSLVITLLDPKRYTLEPIGALPEGFQQKQELSEDGSYLVEITPPQLSGTMTQRVQLVAKSDAGEVITSSFFIIVR